MGEPANPPPNERAETRAIARAVVAAVTNDEPMYTALPDLDGTSVTCEDGNHYECKAVDELVFRLSQEIALLEAELRSVDALDEFDRLSFNSSLSGKAR